MPTENELYELEVLDGELVEPSHAEVEPAIGERLPAASGQPVVQTAVAAATGFVAGAATMALLHRFGQGRLERAAVAPALVPGPRQPRAYVVTVRQLG